MIEKNYIKSHIVDTVAVSEKMERTAFLGKIETRVTKNNMQLITTNNSNLLVKKAKEHRSIEEANTICIIGEKMGLDGKLSKLKMPTCSCNMRSIQYLEVVSTHIATEARACVSDVEGMASESADVDYATMLDDDSAIDEIIAVGTSHYRINKSSATTKHLSKTWNVSQENAQNNIDDATQQ